MTQPFPISFLTAKPDMRGLFGLSLLIQCRRAALYNGTPSGLGGCCQQNPVTPSSTDLL
jgi:hypothetical protein